MDPILLQNRAAWDDRVRNRKSHTGTASDKDFADPLAVVDQCGWIKESISGKQVLCLAAGGGKQSVLFAVLGAVVTVVDLSPEMLELDRKIAAMRGLKVKTIEASMDRMPMLASGCFDLVIQPVSTSYVAEVMPVYAEVARVSKPGGLYISQHKQPACLQGEAVPLQKGYAISEPYYRNGPLPPAMEGSGHREAGTIEFLHRWDELIGGMCRSGFVIEDLLEPRVGKAAGEPGSFEHRSYYLPPFVTVKARRVGEPRVSEGRLWTPG